MPLSLSPKAPWGQTGSVPPFHCCGACSAVIQHGATLLERYADKSLATLLYLIAQHVATIDAQERMELMDDVAELPSKVSVACGLMKV